MDERTMRRDNAARAALAGVTLLCGGCFPVHVLEDSAGEEAMTGGSTGEPEVTPTTGAAPTTGGGEVGAVEIDRGELRALAVGEVAQISASVSDAEEQPIDAAVQWRSSDGLTLYVDGVGGLLGVSPGTATIVAVAGGIESEPVAIEVVAATPPSAPFTAVRALTLSRCAVAGCHVDGVEPGDLRFDRKPEDVWEELVEDGAFQVDMPRVMPHVPRDSWLMHKLALAQPQVGGQMPLAQPPLAASEVQVVLRWIVGGANND